MQQRLISENMLQCSFGGQPYFTAHHKYIAFLSKIDKDKEHLCIKIKTFSKQTKQIQLPYTGSVPEGSQLFPFFFFAKYQEKSFLVVWSLKQRRVDLFVIADDGKQVKAQKKQVFEDVLDVAQNKNYLLFIRNVKNDLSLCGYDFQSNKSIEQIGSISQNQANQGKLLSTQGSNVFYLYQPIKEKQKYVKVFVKKAEGYQQIRVQISYMNKALLVYKDRFIFEEVLKEKRQIEIFDMLTSKIIGKFAIPEGVLIDYAIQDNILMMITNLSNVDRYHFYYLTSDIVHDQKNLITNLSQYEKGKGSHFQLKNCNNTEAHHILQSKTKISSEHADSLVSLVYMIPKGKQKVQVMKISHEKLQENNFGQELVDMVVQSKVKVRETNKQQAKQVKQIEKVSMEPSRFEKSKQNRKSDKNLEQIQTKLIQKLFDAKMKGILDRFDKLQMKLSNLEMQIQVIYEKVERSIENINREEVKRNVEKLFEKVTPQFETYFNEVFRQIARVMDQGETYYKSKLAKEADLHKSTLSKMVNMTFDATKQIIDLGNKGQKPSESTERKAHKLLQIYEKWKEDSNNLTDSSYSPSKYKGPDNPDMKISLNDHKRQPKQQQ